ncbi:MAG: hypothetical protein H6742_09385 [Alphaproteobacteria bacterium]|nr:hypothetical protein [Alphaproteobacteria bacterium]
MTRPASLLALLVLPVALVACKKDPSPGGDSGATGDDTGDSTAPTVCDDGLPVRAFQDAEHSTALYATAADITLPTTDGNVTLSSLWNGCDNILFIQDDPAQASSAQWPKGIYERDVDDFFDRLPPNTLVFFGSNDRKDEDREAALALIQAEVAEALADRSAEDRAWWEERVWFVTGRYQDYDTWLGDHMQQIGWGAWVDREQKVRFIGSYADPNRYSSSVGWFEPNLSMAANEAVYGNYLAERAWRLQQEEDEGRVTIVDVFDHEILSDGGWAGVRGYATVELPDAATMATFDTMEFDLDMGCNGDGEYGTCPAWDYLVYLYQHSVPQDANPWASTACQPYVTEVLGSCSYDGSGSETTCRSDADCSFEEEGADTGASTTVEGVCEGYAAAIAADTQEGICEYPDGAEETRSYTCAEGGAGYQEIACGSREIGRWITTYHREGRYVHDVSSLLPLLGDGGAQTWSFYTTQEYDIDLSVRLKAEGKATRPVKAVHLYDGGAFNASYNDRFEEKQVDIPATATKVELATVISGHGQVSPGTCAEFCTTEHHFYVNGTDNVRELDNAGTESGCMDMVDQGVVPNQYGTWWYGRSGWCPGWQVPVVTIDVTDQVTPGSTATLDYEGFRNGQPYETGGAEIRMTSWLVVHE